MKKKLILTFTVISFITNNTYAAFGSSSRSSSSSSRSTSVSVSRSNVSSSKPSSFASNKSVGLQRNISINSTPKSNTMPTNVSTSRANYTNTPSSNNYVNNTPRPTYKHNNYNNYSDNYTQPIQKDNSTRNAIIAGGAGLLAGGLIGHALSNNSNQVVQQTPVTPNIDPSTAVPTPSSVTTAPTIINSTPVNTVESPRVVYVQTPVVKQEESSNGWLWFFFILIMGIIAYLAYRHSKKSGGLFVENTNTKYNEIPLYKSINTEPIIKPIVESLPLNQAIDNTHYLSSEFFEKMQQNWKPNGEQFIKENTTEELFNSIIDDLRSETNNKMVSVKNFSSKLLDTTYPYVTIYYKANVDTITPNDGNISNEVIEQKWNYIYDNNLNKLLLAGIEVIEA